MKKTVFMLLLLCLGVSLFSQDTEDKKYKNEVAIDVAPFIRQFLSFNNYGSPPSPYNILYRRHINNWAIRLGVGGNIRNDERIMFLILN